MIQAIGGLLAIILTAYFLFDFFLWNGGLVDPSILTRIAEAGMLILPL